MSTTQSYDTHCHINFYPSPETTIAAAHASNVTPIIVTNRSSEYRNLRNLLGPDQAFRLGLGLHPECAGSGDVSHELRILRENFHTADWIAEIGLDGSLTTEGSSFVMGESPTLAVQESMLSQILELGVTDKYLSVHSRFAELLLLSLLQEAGAVKVIFHWFVGEVDIAKKIVDAGYFLSVNPAMLETSTGRALVQWLPDTAILLETDGPFMSWNGRVAEPSDIPDMATAIASVRNQQGAQLLELTSENFLRFEDHAIS